MMPPERFAAVIRMTESNNDKRAFGDSGLALTSYQVHPAWVWDQLEAGHFKPGVLDSWETWIGRMVAAFYGRNSIHMTDVEVAMYFHLGHPTHAGNSDWDPNYAERFTTFAEHLA